MFFWLSLKDYSLRDDGGGAKWIVVVVISDKKRGFGLWLKEEAMWRCYGIL